VDTLHPRRSKGFSYPTPAAADAWDRVISGICDYVSVWLCACPLSERKMAWAIIAKLDTHILYGRNSSRIDPEVKRSKVKVTRLLKLSR